MMKRIINGLSIVLSLLIFTSACEAKTNTNAKFHLVYLVSAEKLKVGAKVFVEPLFFTNGNTIEPIYEKCRKIRYLKNNHKIQNKFVREYCSNKSISLGGEDYFVVSNSGARIKLNKIVFMYNNDKQELPESGISTIRSIIRKNGTPYYRANTISKYTLQYYFFMSKNKNILNKVVSVRTYKRSQTSILMKKAMKLAELKKGFHKESGFKEVGPSLEYSNPSFLIAPLFSDYDGDKNIDIVVGMNAKSGKDSIWKAVGIIYGNGKSLFMGNVFSVNTIHSSNKSGVSLFAPLGVIKTNDCTFLIYRPGGLGAVYFIDLSNNKNAVCKGIGTRKTMQEIQGPEKG